MENKVVAEGKTTNEAIENGLKILKVSKNKVDIKVLENEDKRSFFSILTPRVVKVELTLKEQANEEAEVSKRNNKIKQEIDSEEKKVKDLKQLGYNIYDRDISSDIYNIENTTEFYLTGSELYLIYAYGNDSQTSEKDLVIL